MTPSAESLRREAVSHFGGAPLFCWAWPWPHSPAGLGGLKRRPGLDLAGLGWRPQPPVRLLGCWGRMSGALGVTGGGLCRLWTQLRQSRKLAEMGCGARKSPQVIEGAPRVCGGGPGALRPSRRRQSCSPRMRGWSRRIPGEWEAEWVLPAYAGVVLSFSCGPKRGRRAPRVCGGGPRLASGWPEGELCSPRMRGWSRNGEFEEAGGKVLPAYAGVVPRTPTSRARTACAPCVCGGPENPAP